MNDRLLRAYNRKMGYDINHKPTKFTENEKRRIQEQTKRIYLPQEFTSKK